MNNHRLSHFDSCIFCLSILLLPACQPNAQTADARTAAVVENVQVVQLIDPSGMTIASRFNPPAGFSREKVEAGSFADYLRSFPLLPSGSPVHLYDGRLKNRQDVHLAVLDIDVGKRDLQQCADAVMRLRAEYLWKEKRYAEISFNYTNGFPAAYQRWRNGQRIKVAGNQVNWTAGTKQDTSYASFRRYLVQVFAYAGTLSLEKQLAKRDLNNVEIGDVLIQGGSPGHAVLVVDKAVDSTTGKVAIMLAQSYMPAQEIHVLRNFGESGKSPWYFIEAMKNSIATPEWNFNSADLRRF